MKDFLFHQQLSLLDPEIAELINLETERQGRKLIMIPSESIAPAAVCMKPWHLLFHISTLRDILTNEPEE